nr:6-hydroxymethylpterin diphosphokinase MptE-like protein [Spirochaeta isovalerica]
MIDRLGSWRFRRSKAIFLNSGYNLNKDIYDTLINFAALHLNTFWKNRLTLNKLGALWIRNIFQNLELVQSDLPDNSGKMIVVCGAGPSLDSTINIIREHRNHLYLIAVDTALSTLLDAHIEPDLVFALEAQFYNLGDFHNTGSSSFELLADLTSYPAVCRLNNGRVYFTFTDFAETILINRLKEFGLSLIEIPPLGSVGVAAVYSALTIFSEPIFLTGLDFSYIPGKSHSKGSPFIKSILRSNDRLHPLTNNSGIRRRNIIKLQGKIPETEITTDSILSGYGRLLSELLRDSNRVFDLSREGFPLNIPFVDEKELSEIISSQENTGAEIPCKTIHTFDSRGFLENEQNLLSFVISLWDKFIQSNNSEIPQELMNALVQVDYIYIDFPDKLPHPVNDLSFVSRAVKKAREYSGLIERILKN